MITLTTKITGGKLNKNAVNDFKIFINAHEGKSIEITLKAARSKRSSPQNRYYWGCIIPIICEALKELGHRLNKYEVHEWLKMKFNAKSAANMNGESIGEIPQSTTTLTKTEFMEFIEKIAQWSAEFLNVAIPEPNEQLTIDY